MHCNNCKSSIVPHYDSDGVATSHEDWWTACTGWVVTCLPCWHGYRVDDSDVVEVLPTDNPFYHR